MASVNAMMPRWRTGPDSLKGLKDWEFMRGVWVFLQNQWVQNMPGSLGREQDSRRNKIKTIRDQWPFGIGNIRIINQIINNNHSINQRTPPPGLISKTLPSRRLQLQPQLLRTTLFLLITSISTWCWEETFPCLLRGAGLLDEFRP